jgi:hypothetical protein
MYRRAARLGSPPACPVRSQVREGVLKATSVDFLPVEGSWSKDKNREGGIDFHKAELLEFSVVSIRANPEALMELSAAD